MTAIQNRYSMIAREYEPLFPVLEELDVALTAEEIAKLDSLLNTMNLPVYGQRK